MLYDLHNPLPGPRVIHDGPTPIRIKPGATLERRPLSDDTVARLRAVKGDIVVTESKEQRHRLPALIVEGMCGIGDCLHQRAVVRELMKSWEVWLHTCQFHLHHDLVEQGLHLVYQETNRLRGQVLTQEREKALFPLSPPIPPRPGRFKIWYHKPQIDVYGSILETMFAVCKIKVLDPDLSFPIKSEWRARARALISAWNPEGLPLMVYRPITVRTDWKSSNRNPLPEPYDELFEIARKGYFVVSLAFLTPNRAGTETIVGPRARVDLAIDDGSVPVEIIAAIVAEAQLVFCNPGFMPVLAQCVRTPQICVYGGRESYRTTQRAGAHMAPTLGVDVDRPCDCHSEGHGCDKRLTTSRWIDKVRAFAEEYRGNGSGGQKMSDVDTMAAVDPAPIRKFRVLIFATVYVDSPERQKLTAQWIALATTLNPDADFLIVDSASPLRFDCPQATTHKISVYDFGDNVGHLSRRGKDGRFGRDGWGRAFCKGLEVAITDGYDYVAHIEGDSLLRLPVSQLIAMMRGARKQIATTPVKGMPRDMPGWIETGLMVFDVEWLRKTDFIAKYDWPKREQNPTPEVIVARLIAGSEYMLPIKAIRSDKRQITHQNVVSLDLDWITHCHADVWCYDRFMAAALSRFLPEARAQARARGITDADILAKGLPGYDGVFTGLMPGEAALARKSIFPPNSEGGKIDFEKASAPITGLRLNLGCGNNKIPGWENHDADVDITRALPWPDNAADFVFIEHCVEHVSYHQAIRFFEEAFRVLRPGGVLRVTVPSLEQIATQSDADYWRFAAKWGGEATLKGALRAILFAHGHQQAWTASLMWHSLAYVGFVDVDARQVGQSAYASLRGVEGHGKVIGERFNAIESMPFEATKPNEDGLGDRARDRERGDPDRRVAGGDRGGGDRDDGAARLDLKPVAIVIGGAKCVWDDLAKARADCERWGLSPTYFVVNDAIPEFDGPCVVATLHANDPHKLPVWLAERRARGYPAPSAIWANRTAPLATNLLDDWIGSSGLFAYKVARRMGFDKTLFCGVPMDTRAGHIKRGDAPWVGCDAFQYGWLKNLKDITAHAKSYSGWTAQKIGEPSEEFFR